jgi:FkbM family methyltransferase
MNAPFEAFSKTVDQYLDPEKIRTVYDVGAGQGKETLLLREKYRKAHVYAFEGNPKNAAVCADTIANKSRVTLIPLCIYNRTGTITFHPMCEGFNQYASSIYRWQPVSPVQRVHEQDAIHVPCISLDMAMHVFMLPAADIIWMDLQGAELAAFQCAEGNLLHCKFIHVELQGMSSYHGSTMYKETREHLEKAGFEMITPEPVGEFSFDDFDFVRRADASV